jgi:hypothetical protein
VGPVAPDEPATTPVPLSTIAVADGSLSDSAILAVSDPLVAGAKRAMIVQLYSKASRRPEQESVLIAKSAELAPVSEALAIESA